MKTLACLSFALTFLCIGLAYADYNDPPGWEQDPYFTHQSWVFDSDQAIDLAPDGDWLNNFGTPLFDIWGDNVKWRDAVSGREGVWVMREGSANIDIHVPNEENRSFYKEVWLQITFKSSIDKADVLDMFMAATVETPYTAQQYSLDEYEMERVAPGDRWYYYTAVYTIDPQPGWETFHFSFEIPEGKYIKIDQIDVDTHCMAIPEPASMAFVGLGVLGLALRRRKR